MYLLITASLGAHPCTVDTCVWCFKLYGLAVIMYDLGNNIIQSVALLASALHFLNHNSLSLRLHPHKPLTLQIEHGAK